MRLLTWNVWGRSGDHTARQELIDATLARLSPDVLAIQETWWQGDRWPQIEHLADVFGWHTATARPRQADAGDVGLAVLSRWHITLVDRVALPTDAALDDRMALLTTIETPAGAIPVCTTHLTWQLDHSRSRQTQVRALAALAAHLPAELPPLVLCGDFNAAPGSDEIRMLTGLTEVPVPGIVFQDAWDVAGDGGAGHTWSHRNPAAAIGRFGDTRLDYVFVQWHGRGAILHTEVVPGEHHGQLWASDHFGVLTELDLSALTYPDQG